MAKFDEVTGRWEPKTRYVVGLARVASCYGGPEEGGWYYEAGEPLEGRASRTKVFFRLEAAQAYLAHLRDMIQSGERFPGVGVGGCGDDDGMCRGEVTGGGLDAEIQDTPVKSRRGLVAWPAELEAARRGLL